MKFYLYSKKVHRYLVIVIVFLTLLMTTTGGMLKYSGFFSSFKFIDLALVRYLHNQISLFFSIGLFLMAGSGLVMYFYPILNVRQSQKKSSELPSKKVS